MNDYRTGLNWFLQRNRFSEALKFNQDFQGTLSQPSVLLKRHEQELRIYVQLNQPEETA